MSNAIEVQNISVSYNKIHHAIKNLSFAVRKGSITGFLGPNGAGKTSTIKSILGIISPYTGSIKVFNKSLSKHSKSQIGYLPEIANYYPFLTPTELLFFYGDLFNIDKTVLSLRVKSLLTDMGLFSRRNSLLKTFSKGMLQKISFAQSLINDPDFLILDEPTTGLDPIARMQMRDILIDLKSKGKTIFFSSHELSEVELICDKVLILKQGILVKESNPNNIIDEKGETISLEKYFFNIIKES